MGDDDLKRLRELVALSTEGGLSYGPFDALNAGVGETLQAWMTRTGPDPNMWVTYQRRPDGDYYVAVTGNGPTSEANAALFSVARTNMLALIDEVLRLRAAVLKEIGK